MQHMHFQKYWFGATYMGCLSMWRRTRAYRMCVTVSACLWDNYCLLTCLQSKFSMMPQIRCQTECEWDTGWLWLWRSYLSWNVHPVVPLLRSIFPHFPRVHQKHKLIIFTCSKQGVLAVLALSSKLYLTLINVISAMMIEREILSDSIHRILYLFEEANYIFYFCK